MESLFCQEFYAVMAIRLMLHKKKEPCQIEQDSCNA